MDKAQVEAIYALQQEVRLNAAEHGWEQCQHKPEPILARLALVGTEVAEACEAVRETASWTTYGGGREELSEHGRTEIGTELADCVIRILDLADSLDLNLAAYMFAKIERNKARPHKHGKVI